jgi:HNH endonuclease
MKETKIRERRVRGTGKIDVQCVVCGVTFKAQQCHLPRKKCCSVRCGRISKARTTSGEGSHFWKGGVAHRNCAEFQNNRLIALERDGYKCVRCGSSDEVDIHHIVPYRKSKDHSVSNMETLCKKHHAEAEVKVNPEFAATLFKRGVDNFAERGGQHKKPWRVPFACLVCGKDDRHGSFGLCAAHASTLRYRLKVGLEVIPDGVSRKDFFAAWARRFYNTP